MPWCLFLLFVLLWPYCNHTANLNKHNGSVHREVCHAFNSSEGRSKNMCSRPNQVYVSSLSLSLSLSLYLSIYLSLRACLLISILDVATTAGQTKMMMKKCLRGHSRFAGTSSTMLCFLYMCARVHFAKYLSEYIIHTEHTCTFGCLCTYIKHSQAQHT
jgi:hypothetical protein